MRRRWVFYFWVLSIGSLTVFLSVPKAAIQQISKEELIFLTREWKGARFDDGPPKVSDDILVRMKKVSMEEAWTVLKNAGYGYQIAENWLDINPDSVPVGRTVTAVFMPARPNVWKAIDDRGKKQGKKGQNTWPVDLLVNGNVYVADQLGAHKNGPTIGINQPTRIRQVTVMPGDIVLGENGGRK